MKWLLLFVPMILLIQGCQSAATSARFDQAQTNTLTCQQRVLDYKEKVANVKPQFKSEQNMLMYLMIKELANTKASNDLDACSKVYTAMINADSHKMGKILDGSFRLGSMGLGLWGVSIITNGITDLASDGGSTSNTTYTNSRVVNDSTNSSASGDGMGIGGVFGGRTAQGGLEPRQFQVPDNSSTELNTGSLSGENAPVSLPEAPEVLPVE